MNIVLLHAHAVGRTLAPYGRAADTPHLSAFARRATVFRSAFAASSVRSPALAAIFCGQMPHVVRQFGPAERGFSFAYANSHIAHTLAQSGFDTVHVGANGLFGAQQALPYARTLPVPDGVGRDADVAAAAVRFLEDAARKPSPRPFFLECAFHLAGRPFPHAPDDAEGRFCAPAPRLPDTPRTREDFADYLRTLSFLDRYVGDVLDALARTGRMDDTAVVFTTDHGAPFPLAEGQLTDEGLGVALLIAYPKNPSAGAVCDALVSHLDLYPTLCEWAGAEIPNWVIGKTLIPLMERRNSRVRDELLAETTYSAAYEPLRCLRTDRYKLVKAYDPDRRPVAVNIPDSPSKDVLYEAGWALQTLPALALYDLALDPSEQRNLAGESAYWTQRVDLLARMENALRETGDPLMRGFVPPPIGARLNSRAQRSPKEPTTVYGG